MPGWFPARPFLHTDGDDGASGGSERRMVPQRSRQTRTTERGNRVARQAGRTAGNSVHYSMYTPCIGRKERFDEEGGGSDRRTEGIGRTIAMGVDHELPLVTTCCLRQRP